MKNLIERIETRLDEWGAKLEEKNIEYPVDLICGILFLVIGIVLLLIMPQQVQISEKDVVNGRAFPTMLVWLMLATVSYTHLDVYKRQAVAGHFLEVGLGQLLEDGRMRALAVIIFKIQHICSTPFLQRMTLLCTPARSLSIQGAENSHPLLYL